MPATGILYRSLHPVGLAMARISDSATWREYKRVNPHARLGVRDINGRVVFVIFNPISRGYEQIFLSVQDAISFAFEELTALDYVARVSEVLDGIKEALERQVCNG